MYVYTYILIISFCCIRLHKRAYNRRKMYNRAILSSSSLFTVLILLCRRWGWNPTENPHLTMHTPCFLEIISTALPWSTSLKTCMNKPQDFPTTNTFLVQFEMQYIGEPILVKNKKEFLDTKFIRMPSKGLSTVQGQSYIWCYIWPVIRKNIQGTFVLWTINAMNIHF